MFSYILTNTPSRPPASPSKDRKVVAFPGQYWEVHWGEVDGLGLLYSSQVDVIDNSSKVTAKWISKHTHLDGIMKNILSKRHFMYRTHLYQPPQDTDSWREAMWWVLMYKD